MGRRWRAILPILVACGIGMASPATAALTCTTVTRKNIHDPDGDIFGNRYRTPVAINAAGDVLFASRARFAYEKLYLGKANGTLSVIAKSFSLAPNGDLIAGGMPFRQLSLNDAGDLAFLSPTSRGRALLVKQPATPLEVGAQVGRMSPFTDVRYDAIPQASSINASAVVAFIADLRDERHGIFEYNALTNIASSIYLAGVATTDGRQLCLFEDLELSDSGHIAIVADSSVDCADETVPTIPGLFLATEAGIVTLALQDGASPIPEATYSRLVGRPQMNASDDILFRARLGGASTAEALFFRNAATGEITHVVSNGDPLPTGGLIEGLRDARLATDGSVVVLVKTNGDDERFGLFRYAGGIATPLLTGNDSPPTDQFTAPNRYMRFEPFFGLSRGGGEIGLVARIRDGARPPTKGGVLRCAQ